MKYKGKTYYTRQEMKDMGINEGTIVNWFSRGKREGVKMIEIKKKVLAMDEETFKKRVGIMKEFQERLKINERKGIGVKKTAETEDKTESTEGVHWC